MLKRKIAKLLCIAILTFSLPSFAETVSQSNFTKEEKANIQKVINDINVSVIKSYLSVYEPLNKSLFTTTALQEDFNAKNEYISLVQKGKKITKNKTNYSILKSEVIDNYAKIILNRSINITIDGKISDGKNTEAYLLKKVGNTWKVENIFINWTGKESNAYKVFEDTTALSSFSYNKLPLKTTTGINFKEEVKTIKKNNPKLDNVPSQNKNNVYTEIPINIIINGKKLIFKDQKPILNNNRILVPLRHISENMNAKVIWRSANKSITIKNSNDTYIFTLNEKTYTKNGKKIALDVPPTSTDKGRTIVPLRVISEIFGSIKWDQKTKTATITTKTLNVKPDKTTTNPQIIPSPKNQIENIDISAIVLPLNEIIENNLQGKEQLLSPNYFLDESTYNKANLAFKAFLEQTNGSNIENFSSNYEIKTLIQKGTHIKVVIAYNYQADIKLNDKQKITSKLAPEKIGLVLQKDAIGLRIMKFYSQITDSQAIFNQFLTSDIF